MVFLKVKNVMVVRTPHTSLDILVLVVCERTEDLAKVKDYQLILNLRREVRELLHNFYPVALYNCVTVNFSTCSNVELVPFLKLDLETSNDRTCSKLSPVDFFLIHLSSLYHVFNNAKVFRVVETHESDYAEYRAFVYYAVLCLLLI